MSNSLLLNALGLRRGQVVDVRYGQDGITISGCNPGAERVVHDALAYDEEGRLRVRPDSAAMRSGAQFRLRHK